MINIAINGFGRIGRAAFKVIAAHSDAQVLAVNDLMGVDDMAYLLAHDSVYGRHSEPVRSQRSELLVGDRGCQTYGEADPAALPWDELGIDLVLECTGRFTRGADLEKHLQAGAGRVILSAPAKDASVPTVVYGVNQVPADARCISCASCTTNCVTPVMEVLDRRVGVEKALLTTTHAYTATQRTLDGPSDKTRRGRAAALNLVPTSTGAAKATTQVLENLRDRFDGIALRAPVAVGSVAGLVVLLSRETSRQELGDLFLEEASSDRYLDVLGVANAPLVSSDIIRDPRAAVVDPEMTRVVDGTLAHILCWYDNEWGYANQMIRTALQWLGGETT